MKATKGFSVSDWCRNFEITFLGEQGKHNEIVCYWEHNDCGISNVQGSIGEEYEESGSN